MEHNPSEKLLVETDKPRKEKPLLAALFMLTCTLAYATGFLFSRLIYEHDPNANILQLLAIRGLIIMTVMAPAAKFIKGSLHTTLILPFRHFAWWVYFIAFAGMTQELGIATVIVKRLPMCVTIIFTNMAPFFVTILAVCIINEPLTLRKMLMSTFSFAGVALIILGYNTDEADK